MTQEEQVRENTTTIGKLEVMHKGLMEKIDDHVTSTKEFMTCYYKEDKPRFDSAHRFKKIFMRIFWVMVTPILAVSGYGIFKAITHFIEEM